MPMWTANKRLWRDRDGKLTTSESRGVELAAGPWDRIDCSLEEAHRLKLVDKDGTPLPGEDDAQETAVKESTDG